MRLKHLSMLGVCDQEQGVVKVAAKHAAGAAPAPSSLLLSSLELSDTKGYEP